LEFVAQQSEGRIHKSCIRFRKQIVSSLRNVTRKQAREAKNRKMEQW